jgi:protein O-mannosyl-transferase
MRPPGPPPSSTAILRARAPGAVAALALVAATFVAHGDGLGNGLVWDDHVIVAATPGGRNPETVYQLLSSPDQILRSQPAPYYRPLSRLLFLLDDRLFGLAAWPRHLENLLLHAGGVLALLALARRLFGATVPAFGAALLLAVHPVHAESVAFITARNNLLVALLLLGACLAFQRGRESGRTGPLLLSGALFLLGLLCKETAALLLPFLALRALLPLRGLAREWRGRLLPLAPLAAATALYLALRGAALHSVVGQPVHLADLGPALARIQHIVPEYLRLLLLPTGLTVHHPEPEACFASAGARLAAWTALAAALALLLRQGRPVTRFGLLWAAVHFLPVSTIIPIPSAPIAERYLHLPAIGLWLVAADQWALLWRRPALRRAAAIGGLAAAACLAAVTARRTLDWKDDVALFGSAARVDPASTDASYNLGLAWLERGEPERARREWERTLSLDPRHVAALAQLGTLHALAGRLDLARGYLLHVLAVRPGDVETRFNLAVLLERLGRRPEALEQYQEFLRLDPVDYPDLVPRVRERVRALRAASPTTPGP